MYDYKKNNLLEKLANAGEGVNLPTMCRWLQNKYTVRVVRFWLQGMMEKGLVIKNGLEKGAKFYVNDTEKKPRERKPVHAIPVQFKLPKKFLKKAGSVAGAPKLHQPGMLQKNWVRQSKLTSTYHLPKKIEHKFKLSIPKPTKKLHTSAKAAKLFHYFLMRHSVHKAHAHEHLHLHLHVHDHLHKTAGKGHTQAEKVTDKAEHDAEKSQSVSHSEKAHHHVEIQDSSAYSHAGT